MEPCLDNFVLFVLFYDVITALRDCVFLKFVLGLTFSTVSFPTARFKFLCIIKAWLWYLGTLNFSFINRWLWNIQKCATAVINFLNCGCIVYILAGLLFDGSWFGTSIWWICKLRWAASLKSFDGSTVSGSSRWVVQSCFHQFTLCLVDTNNFWKIIDFLFLL